MGAANSSLMAELNEVGDVSSFLADLKELGDVFKADVERLKVKMQTPGFSVISAPRTITSAGFCTEFNGVLEGRKTTVSALSFAASDDEEPALLAIVEGGWRGEHSENIYGCVIDADNERLRLLDESRFLTFAEMAARTDVSFPVLYAVGADGAVRRK